MGRTLLESKSSVLGGDAIWVTVPSGLPVLKGLAVLGHHPDCITIQIWTPTNYQQQQETLNMQTQRLTLPALMLLSSLLLSLPPTLVQAQIVFENGNVTAPQEAGTYEIKPEAGTLHGPHLEYRFSQFDLPQATDSASFTGPAPGVQNVIGLINGASHSIVNGTLSCNIPDANLYLLNPNGILIGPTATVNVPGSFYAAAANSVTVDGQTFMVTGNAPIFSSIRANLADFGFVRNPGRLTVRGNINVTGSSSSANLVGDEILVQGANISPPGNFEAKGTVINVQDSTINTTNPGSTVKMEGEQITVAKSTISTVGSFEAKGTTSITVQNNSQIKTTDPGSTVKMEGDQITIEDSKVFGNSTPEDKKGIEVTGKSSVSVINSSLEGAGEGAGGVENRIVNAQIEVNSDDGEKQINLQGGNLTVDNSQVQAIDGGIVSINASNINLINGTEINVNTRTPERRGSIRMVSATGSVILNDSQVTAKVASSQSSPDEKLSYIGILANQVKLTNSSIQSPTSGSKQAGTIQIQGTGTDSSSVTLNNNSFVEAPTFDKGKGGNIEITNFHQVTLEENSGILASTTDTATGEAGEISIDTDKLDVTKSSIAIGTLGSGTGGSLTINANEKITLTDLGSVKRDYLPLPLEATIFAGASGSGNATSPGKSVSITTPELAMNHAVIQASTMGSGKAGDIQITATSGVGSVTLENESSIDTPTSAKGQGGNLTINANQVKLTGDSRLGAFTTATDGCQGGNNDCQGGKVTINTGTLDVTKSSIAVGTFGSGNGGALQITATEKVSLEGSIKKYEDGTTNGTQLYSITADSRGSGNATTGPVRIDTPQLTMRNGSAIGLFTFGEGDAGDLEIRANTVELIGDLNSEEPPPNIDASTYGAKDAGMVKIIPKDKNVPSSLNLSHRAFIQSATFGEGKGGRLNINATQITLEDNSGIYADTSPESSGQGGDMTINTSDLTVNESSIAVSTTGTGKTGYLQINATNKIDLIGQGNTPDLLEDNDFPLFSISVDSRGQGNVNSDNNAAVITTPNLNLTDGAVISAATFVSGQGGKLKIEANRLSVNESNIAAATLGSGQGSSIEISSNDISLVGKSNNPNLPNFSNIDVSSRKLNPISQEISERGKAGSLTIGAFSGKEPNITLTDGASISSATETKGDGGSLDIQANNILMEAGTNISAKAEAEGNAGHIKIHASGPLAAQSSQITTESAKSKGGDIEVNTPALAVTGASGSINASVSGQQAGGNISVNVDSLNVTDGGSIKSSTDGQGQGGNVTVNANTVVSISGQSSTLASATSNQGPAGSIQITSPQLALAQGGKIDTSSTAQGNSGRITVQTTGLSLSDQAEITAKATAEGHSGDIQVTTGTLNMNNAAKISADSSEGTGNAGSIRINTASQKADSISLTNDSKITTEANTGAGGSIELHSRDFTLENSEINAEVISGTDSAAPATVTLDTQRLVSRNGTIESSSGGQSSAGNIAITATEYIELTGTSIISKTTGSGAAGQITLGTNNAPLPSLTLTDTNISTTSESSGDSGEISLVVNGDLNLVAGSTLKSESTGGGNPNAKAANITVKSNALTLDGASEISSSTQGASPAGTITLDATSVTNSGKITSEASGSGNAGDIQIGDGQQRVSEVIVNPGENSKISTTASGTGASGTIDFYADKVVVNGGKIQSQATGTGKYDNPEANISFHQANELTINQGGEVSSSTRGASPAGTITVNATKVNLSNGKITSDAEASATGPAGAIVMGNDQRVSELVCLVS